MTLKSPPLPNDPSAWRCRLCGHWLSVPMGIQPFAMLSDAPPRPRECVVSIGGLEIHRCEV